MLSDKQVQNVCNVNGGPDCCRYLNERNDIPQSGYYCMKMRPNTKEEIDDRIEAFLNEKSNATSEVPAMGDHCAGYPVLKLIEQGYDVKPSRP